MRQILFTLMAIAVTVSVNAAKYTYTFRNLPVSQALVQFGEDHPDISIAFIYKELDSYRTSARIDTDDPYAAIRQIIGFNPISVTRKKDRYYIEALQHGKFVYKGRTVGTDNEPVAAATVMFLSPADSTVITYGVTDGTGGFSIPCDRTDVLAKVSCIGYRTTYHHCDSYNVGTIIMPEQAIKLNEVKVEAENAHLYADRSVYIPTQRQKNASQTGLELLDHIAIPQLTTTAEGEIITYGGKSVAMFIDFIPATPNDLKAMRIGDVRKVEFYENPSDPRMSGYQYAVNFIMAQYEYGGYAKLFGHANLLSYSEQLLGNVRFQYKRMTYDLMGYGYGYSHKHQGYDLTEIYRLPQEDGGEKVFERRTEMENSRNENRRYHAAFKATYNSDNIQAATLFSGNIDRRPHSDMDGKVTYSSGFPDSEFSSAMENHSKFLSYSGFYFFKFSGDNALTITPKYTFSHTEQNSVYKESGYSPILNGATDNTNSMYVNANFKHGLDRYSSLLGFVRGAYEYNRTRYTGSAISFDRAKTSRIGTGVTYMLNRDKLYFYTGFGWDWDRLQFRDIIDRPSSPWFDLSLQYAFTPKQSASAVFHYSTWAPEPSFKSANIIKSTPLLSYTGNPALKPSKSYDVSLSYTWIPDNRFSLGANAYAWIKGDRYVYDYEADADGVLRTIKQPLGSFAQGEYNLNATLRLLDQSLVVRGSVGQYLNHNGAPYNVNHSYVTYTARVNYYLRKWNFALAYFSDSASADGAMNGVWVHDKSTWYVSAGWSDSEWNFKVTARNLTRWNWRNQRQDMQSRYYDTHQMIYNGNSHALVQLSLTYTVGYGRKVKRDGEPSVSGSASSGILQ